MSFNFEQIVKNVLLEGEGLEGFDLPPRYPVSRGNIFKRVLFPGSVLRGTKNRYWYVECASSASDKWAINRAAAAQLRRDGVPQSKIREHLFKFQDENPPTVKTVKSDLIPDNEKNVIVLKGS
jgi:hypothetical protein